MLEPERTLMCCVLSLTDLHNSLFLVHNGEVAPMLKRPLLSSLIPPILPEIRDMRFHFNASAQVRLEKKERQQ